MKWPESTEWHDGVRKEFRFDNGYIVSLVKFTGSYGWRDGLWELAIIDGATQEFVDPPISILNEYPAADRGIYGFLNDPQADEIIQAVRDIKCQ